METLTENIKFYFSERTKEDEKLNLSVLLSQHGFTYAISGNGFKTVFELYDITLKSDLRDDEKTSPLSGIMQNHLLTQKKFEQINICILDRQFSIIPEAYGEGENLKKLHGFSTGNTSGQGGYQHSIQDFRFSYSFPSELSVYLEKTFPNASVRHAGAVNISLFFDHPSLSGTDAWLNVQDKTMEVIIKNKNTLKFYNIFNYTTNEDILYYLLFSLEQNGLSPESARLAISSNFPANHEVVLSIHKYIKTCKLLAKDKSIVLPASQKSMPDHYYFTLLNQHLCVL